MPSIVQGCTCNLKWCLSSRWELDQRNVHFTKVAGVAALTCRPFKFLLFNIVNFNGIGEVGTTNGLVTLLYFWSGCGGGEMETNECSSSQTECELWKSNSNVMNQNISAILGSALLTDLSDQFSLQFSFFLGLQIEHVFFLFLCRIGCCWQNWLSVYMCRGTWWMQRLINLF